MPFALFNFLPRLVNATSWFVCTNNTQLSWSSQHLRDTLGKSFLCWTLCDCYLIKTWFIMFHKSCRYSISILVVDLPDGVPINNTQQVIHLLMSSPHNLCARPGTGVKKHILIPTQDTATWAQMLRWPGKAALSQLRCFVFLWFGWGLLLSVSPVTNRLCHKSGIVTPPESSSLRAVPFLLTSLPVEVPQN